MADAASPRPRITFVVVVAFLFGVLGVIAAIANSGSF